jgi:hypothetical protein
LYNFLGGKPYKGSVLQPEFWWQQTIIEAKTSGKETTIPAP